MWSRIKKLFARNEHEKTAREAFELQHPGAHIAWTRIVADEPSRVVVGVGVYHGNTRPPRIVFYAVDKPASAVTAIEDDAAYRPRNWR